MHQRRFHHHGHGQANALMIPALMVPAMMLPVAIPRVRRVAFGSIGRIRARAVAETVIGFTSVWLVVGLALHALPAVGARDSAWLFLASWLAAGAWQLTSMRSRALNACHAVSVAPGLKDGKARIAGGVSYARWCVATCGPAMAVMMVTRLSPPLMALLTAGLVAERITPRPRTTSRRLAAAMVVVPILMVVI
jgi:hypothetical protein